MSRVNEKDTTQLFDAADKWKIKCLLNSGSIFENNGIWVDEYFK
jgi:hypothetical protein